MLSHGACRNFEFTYWAESLPYWYTDHQPLVYMVKKFDSIKNAKLLAMFLSIAEYDFVILYLKGARNVLADCGTRQLDPEE